MKPGSHIVILCSRLDLPGGIERAVVNTANLFARNGHKVTLLVLDETKETFYPVDSNVQLVQLPLSFGITPEGNVVTRKIKLLSDVLALRKILRQLQPSIVICTEYPFSAAAVLCGAKKQAKVISWEHHHFYELKKNLFWNRVFRLTYPRLDSIVCLNTDEENLFATINTNTAVIPNFIDHAIPAIASRQPILLTVARLTDVKGTDMLLEVAKTVLKKNPGWKWKIIGDGDMRGVTLSFIEKEGLQDQLNIQAPVNHEILNEYRQAGIYIMTSRHECFPMTLLEAQACGLPCIAFDCDTGPRHIITHNKNGLLVEKNNTAKLAEAINMLIDDETLREEMAVQSLKNIQQFSPGNIYKLWEEKILPTGQALT